MKKRKRMKTKSNSIFFVLFSVFLTLIILYYQQGTSIKKNDPFADVKMYRPLIYDELAKYHMQNYTTVLAALMEQESHGKGGDPMQASESVGLSRNSIKNPGQSIKVGVKYFHHVLTYGQQKNVDFPTIIQAYNMGIGYIDFISSNGGKHSEDLAKNFSLQQVRKHPTIYTCGGDKTNFRYPYCYGDYTYSTKVTKNIQSLAESVPVLEAQKPTN